MGKKKAPKNGVLSGVTILAIPGITEWGGGERDTEKIAIRKTGN